MTKFVASLTEVNKDTDILVEDIHSMGINGIPYFVNEAIERGDDKEIFVVDADMTMAENVATLLNIEFEKEMELMKQANIVKEEVQELVESVKNKAVIENKAHEDKNAAARKFLEQNGAAILNSKKVTPNQTKVEKDEETMENNTTIKGRRRVAGAIKIQNETKTNEKVEKDMREGTKKEDVKVTGRKRLSGSRKEEVKETSRVAEGRRRVKRGSSMRGNGFAKHEGQWWSNASLYSELQYVQSIIDNMDEEGMMSCPELDIEAIVFVDPEQISRYRNRQDIDVVIQLKSNGAVLEFPIKEASANSKSPLASTSIGWVEYNGKVRPAFGFWRPNAMEIEVKCGCGNTFKANTGNLYCPKCKTRHDDALVEIEHESLDFVGDVAGWVFQEVPNLVVPKGFLALVMALAHWDAGYDMEGLVEEDAE